MPPFGRWWAPIVSDYASRGLLELRPRRSSAATFFAGPIFADDGGFAKWTLTRIADARRSTTRFAQAAAAFSRSGAIGAGRSAARQRSRRSRRRCYGRGRLL